METIRIQVSSTGIYAKLLAFLKRFKSDEVHIIKEDEAFLLTQAQLKKDLHKIDSGNADFDTLETLENKLDARIKKYEN